MELTTLKYKVNNINHIHGAIQPSPHQSQNIFITLKETHPPTKQSLPVPHTSCLSNHHCFLSLWVCLVWIVPINRSTWHVTLYAWLLSLSIVFFDFHPSWWKCFIPFCSWTVFHYANMLNSVYPFILVDIWMVSTFWLL